MKKLVVLIIACLLVVQGCSSSKDTSSNATDSSSSEADTQVSKVPEATVAPTTTVAPTATTAPTATVAPTEATTPKPVQLILPLTDNNTGKVLIQTVSSSFAYPFNSYIITSVGGEKVVVDPTAMPGHSVIDINPTAIVSTHSHPDHTDPLFVKSYPDAQTLLYTEGDFNTEDFHIYSVKAAHNGDEIDGSDYVIVFEVDGLRIAHMGDIGQTTLTEDQLKAIGEIDIAFMQFENSYSSMSVANEKGFNLIKQLDPKIIIPTHYTAGSRKKLEEDFGPITEIDNVFELTKDDLPEDTLHVNMIKNTHKYR